MTEIILIDQHLITFFIFIWFSSSLSLSPSLLYCMRPIYWRPHLAVCVHWIGISFCLAAFRGMLRLLSANVTNQHLIAFATNKWWRLPNSIWTGYCAYETLDMRTRSSEFGTNKYYFLSFTLFCCCWCCCFSCMQCATYGVRWAESHIHTHIFRFIAFTANLSRFETGQWIISSGNR